MAKRTVLWVYEPNGALFTKHVVKQGWNAVQAVDLIRTQWGGIWEGEAFLPWHSIYKILSGEEEISDGESKEGKVHGGGQAQSVPGTSSSSDLPESQSGSARLQGSGVAHP